VDRIRAKIVGEGANGPTTAKAGDKLHQRGVLVIPDMYLNGGGVTVSYFEWLKNLSHVRFGRLEKRFEEHANRRLLQAVHQLTGKSLSEADREVRAKRIENSARGETRSSYHSSARSARHGIPTCTAASRRHDKVADLQQMGSSVTFRRCRGAALGQRRTVRSRGFRSGVEPSGDHLRAYRRGG
jgi:NAD-specific glutamate dehydrogenase